MAFIFTVDYFEANQFNFRTKFSESLSIKTFLFINIFIKYLVHTFLRNVKLKLLNNFRLCVENSHLPEIPCW